MRRVFNDDARTKEKTHITTVGKSAQQVLASWRVNITMSRLSKFV